MSRDHQEASPARTVGYVSARGLLRVLVAAGVVAAAVLQLAFLAHAASRGNLAIDLKQAYLPAAKAILERESPYPELTDTELGRGDAYVYPPLVAFGTIPLAALRSPDAFATALGLASIIAALLIVGLRDWRCYVCALAWVPVFHGVQTANVTLVLLLGIALTWRLRDRKLEASLATGLTIAAKLVSWPLVVWLAATRRLTAAFGSLIVAIAITFGLWAALGFAGLTSYWRRIRRLSDLESPDSYTFSALLTDFGASEQVASASVVAVGAACILGVIVAGRHGDDARALSFAVFAVVACSPIVWLHSFVVLLVPLALAKPRFSVAWLLPATLWFASGNGNGAPLQTALVLLIMTAVALSAVTRPRTLRIGRVRVT